MSPSSSFVAVDIIKDNIIFVARAEFGVQVAVVVNGHEWDTDKQVKLQTCQLDDACLAVDSYRCKGAANKVENFSKWIPVIQQAKTNC